MYKKLWIATAAGTLAYLACGWLVFGLLFGNYTEAHTTSISGFRKTGEQYSVALLVVSCMAYAALISFILIYLLDNRKMFRGFFIGTVTGMLVAVMTDSYWYATSTFYSDGLVVIIDILCAGITVGLLGLTVSWINHKLSGKA